MSNGETTEDRAPYALSLIICDRVFTDSNTGKQAIVGCFGSIAAWRFPAVHPLMTVFAEMTDGLGSTELVLRVVAVDHPETVFERRDTIEFPSRLAVAGMRCVIQGIVFPRQGEYRVQLFANGEFLLERRLLVVLVETDET